MLFERTCRIFCWNYNFGNSNKNGMILYQTSDFILLNFPKRQSENLVHSAGTGWVSIAVWRCTLAGGLWWTSNWCSHLDIRNSRVGKIMASHNNDLELLLLAAHKLIICMIVFKLPGSAENSTTWRQLCVSANWRFDFRDINQRKST